MVQGPASSTVTGTLFPSAPKTCVMPRLRAISPCFIALAMGARPVSLELDLDVDPRRQVELGQGVHRLGRRVEDVEEPLVRTHLELLPRLLVHVGRPEDGP